ncbi:MAG TPA: hypothetical protein VNJ07_06060 [Chitinophagales bacterium]|nr:hypothetical protein [Chitinophagales bacterium]
MDVSSFSALLKKPFRLKDYSLSELHQLSQQFPYSSLISTLIALKARLDDDGNFEHYLSQAAIRIPDRKRLYHLLHEGVNPADVEELEKEITDDVELMTKPLGISIQKPEPPTPPREAQPSETESILKVSITDDSKPVVVNKEIAEPETIASLQLPGINEMKEALKSMKEDKEQNELPPSGDDDIESVDEVQSSERSFTEWLALMKQKAEKPASPVLKEIKESSAGEIHFTQNTQLTDQEEARLAHRAKESLTAGAEMITETLAKIYESQKKYDKAIEAYRILSLKYPDKKAYFAQRIESLKFKASNKY